MSLELIRQALTAAVEAAKTGAPVSPLIIEYDNRLIVEATTQTQPFLAVKVKLQDGMQADLSANPLHRFLGQLHIAAVVKENTGASKAQALLDHFYPQLQGKQFGGVRTKMATFTSPKTEAGLVYYPVLIPFWFDKIY